jgi:EpsI family protein
MKIQRFLLVALLLVCTGIVIRSLDHGSPVPLARPLSEFPARIGDWQGRAFDFSDRVERKLGTGDYLYQIYRNGLGQRLSLYVGYYPSQRHGEMIHSPKNCLPGNGWYIEQKQTTSLNLPPYPPFPANRFVVRNGNREELVLYWYQQAGDRIVTDEYVGRVLLVMDAVMRNRTDAALVRVSVPIVRSETESFQVAVDFLREAHYHLKEFLPK